jgi:CBS domain-containing protein
MKKKLVPTSPLVAVRADTSIASCVRLMRDRAVGSLVIVSANVREDLVGIFTERDLLKNVELIQKGNFWEHPVRTVMTSPVRTVSVDKLAEGPRIMARYSIRHLPVVSVERGRTRVVGVLSMRDLFRFAMEKVDYELLSIMPVAQPPRSTQKMVGIFSADKSVRDLVDQAARQTEHLLVKARALPTQMTAMEDAFSRFDGLVVDIDGVAPVHIAKFLARAAKGKRGLLVLFSPLTASPETKTVLHQLAESKRVPLLAKPLSLGLFFEKFLTHLS